MALGGDRSEMILKDWRDTEIIMDFEGRNAIDQSDSGLPAR